MRVTLSKKQKVITKIKEGYPISTVSHDELVDAKTITKWLVEYISSGEALEAFDVEQSVKRFQILTPAQIEWIYYTITNKTPSEVELEGELWTRNIINKLIRQWCEKKYSTDSAYRLTSELGFNFPEPESAVSLVKHEISGSLFPQKYHFFYLNSFELKKGFRIIPVSKGKEGATVARAKCEPTKNHVLYAQSLHRKGVKFIVESQTTEASVNYFADKFAKDFNERAYFLIEKKSLFDNPQFPTYIGEKFKNFRTAILEKSEVFSDHI